MNVTSIHSAHTVNSSVLSFKDNLFTGEFSDFGPDFKFRVDLLGTASFFIQSEKTGDVREFRFVVDERNSENEVLFTVFRCVTPSCRHLTAKIFND